MSETTRAPTADRRRFLILAGAGGVVLTTGLLLPSAARATRLDVAQAIGELTGGRQPKPGNIRIDLPEIAEYGDTVPLSIEVESPMTAANHVSAIHVFAEENPRPHVATFRFTPISGKAHVSTRIRLAKTQKVVAVAETSNGELHMVERLVRVTIGGCGN